VSPVGRLPDGQFLVRVHGESGGRYAIDISPNLSAWTAVKTNTAPADGIIDFIDTTAPGAALRFYRARLVP
jgi:hypothetical protein